MEERIYTDEEFVLILHKAAELAHRSEQPGAPTGGLTLMEMKSAASQAGLDPTLIERAARELATRVSSTPFERIVGGPLRHHQGAHFPVKLDEETAARLLSVIQINSSSDYTSASPGHSSALGMRWDSSGDGNVLSVAARPDASGTAVSVDIDRRGTFVLTGVASLLAVLTSFLVGMLLNDVTPLLGVGATAAGVGGTLLAARSFWASSTRKARERIGALVDVIGETIK